MPVSEEESKIADFDGNDQHGNMQPAVPAVVVTHTAPPAGGVGTAAGGYDTAANRDAMIAVINQLRVDVDALKTAQDLNRAVSEYHRWQDENP